MAITVAEVGAAVEDVDLAHDRDLVVRYQHDDEAAFEELFRRYWLRLLRFCERRVSDPHTAEEIAQEAFVRALRAMPTFGGDRRFYPWLSVIAGRLCIDHHRKHARIEPSADIDTQACEPDHDHLFSAVDRQHVAEAVARLSARHRDVLVLREQRDLSYQQIADHLGVPRTTVEALLHRARQALRREYLVVTGRRVAALPILTVAVRTVDRLRDNLGARLGDVARTIGSAAAGVATVGAATIMPLAPTVHGDHPADRAAPPAAVVGAGPVSESAPPPAPDPAPVAPASAPVPVADAPSPATWPVPHATAPAGRARPEESELRASPPIDGLADDAASPERYAPGYEVSPSIGSTTTAPVVVVDAIADDLLGD